MANFLDDLSVYNAKAALAISQAAADGNTDKANMMSSLKTTANDTTLTEAVRLNALTALINLGSLLDVPLPPYFPLTVTYANTETYIGIHDDLSGLQGGAPGDYQHLTTAEKVAILNKASIGDITFANLGGIYSDNNGLAAVIDGKQTELNGVGLVRINGNQSTITYDNTSYISTISGISAGGELTGTYPNPALSNAAVIAKVLTGWNGSATYTAITPSDTILSGMEKLNARISQVIASPGGVSSIAAQTNASSILNVSASTPTGNVTFSVDFDTQNQNLFLASPNGSSGLPSFRAIVADDLPNSGATAGTYGTAALIPQITVDAKGRITAISNVTANAGGLVTAVSLTGPAIFTSYGSTGGATPQLSFALANQSANLVFAGPATGAATTPTFRALVEDDVPFLAGIVSGLQNQINSRLPQSLNTSLIYMGNGSGVAAQSVVGGDLTAAYTEPGNVNTATFTIANAAVTYAKFANIPDSALNTIRPILLGRFSSGQGPMQQLTLSGDFTLNAGTGEIGLLTPNPPELTDAGDLLTSSGANVLERLSLPVDYSTKGYLLVPYAGTTSPDIKLMWGEVGGDITYSINTTATPFPEFVIGANKVTLGKMQQLPAYTVIGNDTSGTATPTALSKAELTLLVDQFTSSTPGVVPLSGGGTTNFLRADGSWTAPPSGGSPAGSGTEVQYRLSSTTFGAIPYMAYDSTGGEIRTAGPNFLLVDDVTTVAKSVYFDISNITSTGLSWAFPDTTDTFVGETFVQTIQNKTLGTGAAINLGSSVVGTMWYSSDTAGTLAELDPTGLGGKYLMLNATTLIPEWTGVTATTANNIAGGAANKILYQTAVDTTGFIDAPTTADTFLKWNGSAFTWAGAGSGSGTVTSGGNKELAYYNSAGTTVQGLSVSPSNGTFILSQTITAGTPANPSWTAVTGTGNVVLATSPTLATPILGTPQSGTLTSCTGLPLSTGVTGTLPIANGGTGVTGTPTNGQLLIGNGTGYTLATLTQGSGITITNTAGSISIASSASAPTLNQLQAATAANTPINNANFAQEWQWNTLGSGNGFFLSSTSTAAASNTQTLFRVALSGPNATTTQSTFAGVLSNTHTGTSSTNYALQLTASGGTTNYALDVTAGIVRMAASTASVPHMVLTPGTAALTGTTDGMLSYATVGNNSSLYLTKLYAASTTLVTKLITLDRNPDFATGSTSGVIVADSSGTLSKSADLTALGIFSVYANTGNITTNATETTMIGTSLTGSATLPANFFGVGKTIRIFASGTVDNASNDSTTIRFKLGSTTIGTFSVTAMHDTNTNDFVLEAYIICNAASATGTVRVGATFFVEGSAPANEHTWYMPLATQSGTINTTNALALDITNQWGQTGSTMVVNFMTCYYLN